jgi:hypothetical protein
MRITPGGRRSLLLAGVVGLVTLSIVLLISLGSRDPSLPSDDARTRTSTATRPDTLTSTTTIATIGGVIVSSTVGTTSPTSDDRSHRDRGVDVFTADEATGTSTDSPPPASHPPVQTTTPPVQTTTRPPTTTTRPPTTTTTHPGTDLRGLVYEVSPDSFTLAPRGRSTVEVVRTNTSTWTMRVDPSMCLTIDVPDETEYCLVGIFLGYLEPGESITWTKAFTAPATPGTYWIQIWENFPFGTPQPAIEIPLTVTS